MRLLHCTAAFCLAAGLAHPQAPSPADPVVLPSGVRVVDVGTDALTIAWQSPLPAAGRVTWGVDRARWRSAVDAHVATRHAARLTGLRPSTRIWFRLDPAPGAEKAGQATGLYSTATAPRPGRTQYLRLPWLVLVSTPITYRDLAAGQPLPPEKPARLTDEDLARLRGQMETVRAFYWRNSRCRLDVRWDYFLDSEPFVDTNAGRQAIFEKALKATGRRPEDYAGCLFLFGWDEFLDVDKSRSLYRGQAFGGLTYGVDGAWDYKRIPFSWIRFNRGADVSWTVTHEFHHALDSLFEASGYRDYAFNHPDPKEPIGPFGEHWDANAYILRTWRREDWFCLARGSLHVAPDRVGDGMPEAGDLPITRARFHGRGRRQGWTDMRMLLESNGVLTGISNDPIHMDRWGGRRRLPDGRDSYPLYPRADVRPCRTPLVDGSLEPGEWSEFVNLDDPDIRARTFCQWDADALYFAARCSRPAELRFQIDARRDGWFSGSDNYRLNVRPRPDGGTEVEVSLFDWDRFGQPNQYVYTNREKVRPGDIRVATGSQGGDWIVEIAIPRNEKSGLLLRAGDRLGLSLGFAHSNPDPRTLVSLFEPDRLFGIRLVDR